MSSKGQLSPFGMALAGALGGIISGSVVYPLDTVKTRIQTDVTKAIEGTPKVVKGKNGARRMFMRILKEQGVAGLYRGFSASMLNTFSMQFAYFYWYTIVRRTYVKKFFALTPNASLNTITELALGALAAAFSQLFTIPVSVIATRQQLSTKSSSISSTFLEILSEDGITGLWRGLKPSLVLCINPAITYGMFERLKSGVLKPGEKMTPGKAFVLGALSKTMATIVTYPYILAKTRLQAKFTIDVDPSAPLLLSPSGESIPRAQREKYSGAIDCLKQVMVEKGLGGWYQGMQAQITKAVFSQALLFGIKDLLEVYVLLALISAGKMTGRSMGFKQE